MVVRTLIPTIEIWKNTNLNFSYLISQPIIPHLKLRIFAIKLQIKWYLRNKYMYVHVGPQVMEKFSRLLPMAISFQLGVTIFEYEYVSHIRWTFCDFLILKKWRGGCKLRSRYILFTEWQNIKCSGSWHHSRTHYIDRKLAFLASLAALEFLLHKFSILLFIGANAKYSYSYMCTYEYVGTKRGMRGMKRITEHRIRFAYIRLVIRIHGAAFV